MAPSNIFIGGAYVEVSRAFKTPETTGNTEVVAAQGTGVKIRVIAAVIVTTLANVVKFQSSTDDISPAFPFGANGGAMIPTNSNGWFETAANQAFNVNLGVATKTAVHVLWVPVK